MNSIARALGAWLLVAGLALAAGACGDERRRVEWPRRDPAAREAAPAPHGAAVRPPAGAESSPERRARPSPRAGRFLVAARSMDGPIFGQSVVLLLDYSRTGALGLIVNRPTRTSLHELLPALDTLTDRDDRVFLGGPVETQRMVFLIRSDAMPPESQHVIGDIHATGSADALRVVIEQEAPASRFHAYVGYAGWAPGQLDAEIARGDWYVHPAEADQVFDPSLGDLWDRLVFEHEGTQVRAPAASVRLAAFDPRCRSGAVARRAGFRSVAPGC